MSLITLSEDGHGRVVREIAEAIGQLQTISFLEDHNPEAVGVLNDYKLFRNRCEAVFVAIGDNKL